MLNKTDSPAIGFDFVRIGLASTERILSWSHGEVEKPETINYRTFKPEHKGLFCEKIFGPVKDWECHCGKYKRIRYRGIVCERCGVEVTTSRVRRERMGHIKLAIPVSHVWFLKGVPGFMSIMLDVSTRSLEEVIYYDAYIVTDVDGDVKGKIKVGQILREADYQKAKEQFGSRFKVGMGASGVRKVLSQIEIPPLVSKLRRDLRTSSGQKRMKIIKRLRVTEAFLQSGNRPEWMILEMVPVMPPDLRPMVQLEGGRFATSDLNDLYRRVLNRNNRLKKMIAMGAPDMIVRNEKRMLQEAVDVLIDNGKRRRAVMSSTGRPLKSLSDIIEGKQGRFRQNLLGKRADYSGRSVIVVGPSLKMHQCGLPKEMALELFKPFVIRRLVEKGFAQNVKNAKRQIERREVIVWDMLEEVIKGHPVLLNRAPTLHRLGVQAFEPILVEGKAIQIHPLVCSSFNADFDGDQMAVHVPLLAEAQTEARILMLSTNNLLSPASGRPVVTPTQDMVLGSYYMTIDDERATKGKGKVFSNFWEAMIANDTGELDLHALIKVRNEGQLLETTVGRIKFNYTLNRMIDRQAPGGKMEYINRLVGKKELEKIILQCYQRFGVAATAGVADEIKRLGFKYATLAGISISLEDLRVPPTKKDIIRRANAEVEHLEKLYRSGVLSEKERFLRSLDVWSETTEEITQAMLKGFDRLNPVYMMAFSGARGNIQQVRQLAGIRGLMADPSGNIINIPIKTNFKEGLSVAEYFISSYGARKGLVDTALRTADSGYLTRRLVDVSQDVIIIEEDCKTKKGITISSIREGYEEVVPLSQRLVGRIPQENVSDPFSKKVLVKKGEEISEEEAKEIEAAGVKEVKVRSPLTCGTVRGLCQKCYGRDLSSGKIMSIGEAVGIIAAQSIGEPGTQLTMRTFHIGGVALHKGRKVQIKSKHAGKIVFSPELEVKDIIDTSGNKVKLIARESKIAVKVRDKKEEYILPVGAVLKVKEGAHVLVGGIISEFDPSYSYVVAALGGKVKFMSIDIMQRKRKLDGKKIIDNLVERDGEVFVYNPKAVKVYDVLPGRNIFVSQGDRVEVGAELSGGVNSKVAGVVIDIEKKSKKKRSRVFVAPGEVYKILAGSQILIEDGATLESYDIISRVEVIRQDPSKTRDIVQGLPRIEELFEARRPKIATLLADIDGKIEVTEKEGMRQICVTSPKEGSREYLVPYEVRLRVTTGDRAYPGLPLTAGTINPHEVLRILGVEAVQRHLVGEIQKIYRSQGVTINDKHIEVIVRQMTKKIRVLRSGDTALLPGELISIQEFEAANAAVKGKGESATLSEVLLGITKASLSTDSFISGASFQETARVLTDAAIKGRVDEMYGLKENVIIGKLIPAGTGFSAYQLIEPVPAGAVPEKKKEEKEE